MEKKRTEISTTVASDFFLDIESEYTESSAVESTKKTRRSGEDLLWALYLKVASHLQEERILKSVEQRWQNVVSPRDALFTSRVKVLIYQGCGRMM